MSNSLHFMGLWETIAWVGTRDQGISDQVSEELVRSTETRLTHGALEVRMSRSHDLDVDRVFNEIAGLCALGELVAKGQGADGFQNVPADDWHEATFTGISGPDTIMGLPVHPSGERRGWRRIRFLRADVLRRWPPVVDIKPQTPLSDEPRRRGGGPKPREYAEPLADLFRKQHDFIANMTERERHKYVLKFLTGGRPESERTTQSHWERHPTRRANLP